MGSWCGWIEAYYEGCTGLDPDSFSESAGGGLRGDSPCHYTPERRSVGTLDKMGGTEVTLERCEQSFGAIAIEERAGLHGVPILSGHDGGDRKNVEADARDAGPDECDGFGRCMREIDDAVLDEGATVGDTDFDGFVVAEIDHAHPGPEGQGTVRGGELFHIVDFAVGGGAAVIGMSVPAGEPGFAVSDFSSIDAGRSGCGGRVVLPGATGERQTSERRDRGRQCNGSARGHLL